MRVRACTRVCAIEGVYGRAPGEERQKVKGESHTRSTVEMRNHHCQTPPNTYAMIVSAWRYTHLLGDGVEVCDVRPLFEHSQHDIVVLRTIIFQTCHRIGWERRERERETVHSDATAPP